MGYVVCAKLDFVLRCFSGYCYWYVFGSLYGCALVVVFASVCLYLSCFGVW